jgi:serine/threonine protein kinase
MGDVYRATDSNQKRSVAIRGLPAAVGGECGSPRRFQREAEVLAALNHSNTGLQHWFCLDTEAGATI